MSASHHQDTPVADSLAALEPTRVPVQDVSAIARGPYDPAGQPRLASPGFVLGLDGWNLRPWPEARELVVEAERLGFGLVVAAQAEQEDGLDAFAASNTVAADSARVLVAPSVSLRAHLHPMHVARFVANIDHVAGGRGALVFNAGDDAARAALFGLAPAAEPEAEADEFVTLVKHAWAWSTPFGFEGHYYASRRAWLCGPRPSRSPRPFLALRGGADVIDAAARSFDWLIVDGAADVSVARAARDRAVLGYGRRLAVFASMAVAVTPAGDLAAHLAALAQVECFDGVLLTFDDGLRGLHEFGARVLPALTANALRWPVVPGGMG